MLSGTSNLAETAFLLPEAVCRCFSLEEIELATQNFNEALVIGRGGFGKVYKAHKNHVSDSVVAIKRLHSMSKQGAKEFRAEVEMLSKVRHCNLVSLIGYCNQGIEMALVYEYMPQGTLEDHLHKACETIPWLQRLKICIGSARGLDYLHTGTGTQHGIIHRDVKSSNILLDNNFAAKISDFGLAKIGPTGAHVITLVKGTFGYIDPCYYNTGILTRKSDVYSYGVILLEVICGRRAVDTTLDQDQWGLAQWAQDRIKQGKLNHIIDCRIRGQISSQCQKDFARLACRCLHNQPDQRPTMAEVVSILEGIISLQERADNAVSEGNTIEKVLCFISAKTDNNISAHPRNTDGDKAGNTMIPQRQEDRMKTVNLKAFQFEVIKVATRNFRPPAVVGGHIYSSLHKGWIDENDDPAKPGTGIPIAVKRLSNSLQGQQEWLAEINYFLYLNHPNIVKLLGYCIEKEHKMLVCEFMSGGNLGKHLFRKSSSIRPLPWNLRMKAALGAAKGLAYLHSLKRKHIHRDLKSSSILLDSDYNAKLCILWCAKDGPVDGNSLVATRVLGTNGYSAPESVATGDVTLTSDIYTFGVVLLEMLTGRRCIDKKLSPSEQVLVEFAMPYLKDKERILQIIDPRIRGQYTSTVATKAAKLALKCLCVEPKQRMIADDLVNVLEQLQDFSK